MCEPKHKLILIRSSFNRNFLEIRSHSGSGYDHYSGYFDCCPKVVDPMVVCTILTSMAVLAYVLWRSINLNQAIIGVGRKRRKRMTKELDSVCGLFLGKFIYCLANSSL